MDYTYTIQTFTDIMGNTVTNILRSDYSIIPTDSANSDYQAYLATLAANSAPQANSTES